MADSHDLQALDMTVVEALEKWVAQQPDKRLWTYLDDAGRETSDKVTYAQLDDRTRALSETLLAGTKGWDPVRPGDRVLLVYPPSLHFIVAFVACLRAGVVAVPVYPPDPRKLRKDVQAFSKTAQSCGAKVALTSSSYDHMKKVSGIKARLTGDDSRWPDSLRWLVTDKLHAGPSRPPSAAVAAAPEKPRGRSSNASGGALPAGEGGPEGRSSLAFLQYTSGSTGDPKGVKITHGNLAHNLGAIVRELKAGEDTVVVSWLPQYHDMGLIGSVLGILYCGGSGYYISPLDFIRSPPTWIKAVSHYRATHLQAPNFAFALCARKWKALKTQSEVDLSSVVHMINASEPIDPTAIHSFEAVFGPYGLKEGVIKPTYGLAEHTVFVCSGGEQRLRLDKRALEVAKEVKLAKGNSETDDTTKGLQARSDCDLVGCGYPSRVRGVELLIVDPSTLAVLPEDRVGEVWVRSPSKAQGYWGLLERSKEAFCAVPLSETRTVRKTREDDGGDLEAPASDPPVPDSKLEPSRGADEAEDGEPEHDDGVALPEGSGGEEDSTLIAPEAHSEAEQAQQQQQAAAMKGVGRGSGNGAEGPVDYAEGFLRTGDEGFMHRGELFICGRIKDLIIIGGRNHYPQDLERTAERGKTESIRAGCSAAFSIPGSGDAGGERLVLVLEVKEPQAPADQRKKLGEEIRSAVTSEHGVDVNHLLLLAPRGNKKTTSGKIARRWCRQAFLEGGMEPLLHLQAGSGAANAEESGARHGGVGPSAESRATKSSDATNQGASGQAAKDPDQEDMPKKDASAMTDEQVLSAIQKVVSQMNDGSMPDPDAAIYTLGLSSMAMAQFSGRLEQEYGARVPLATLDGDNVTLRSLVPLIKAGGVAIAAAGGDGAPAAGQATSGASGAVARQATAQGEKVSGVTKAEEMVREAPGKCEQSITNSCPCCLCLLACPCCT